MEDLLRENIQRTIGHSISDSEFEQFSKFLFPKSFDKKAILSEEGEHCKYVYFILKGSAYSYFVNEHGDKHAIQFALEGYWITDHYSFFSGKPGIYTIETLEPSQILVLNQDNYEKICRSNHMFEHFFRILIQNAFIGLQYRLAKLMGTIPSVLFGGTMTLIIVFFTYLKTRKLVPLGLKQINRD